MKTKILSIILSVLALGGVWLLLRQTAHKEEFVPAPANSTPAVTEEPEPENEESDAFVIKTAHDAEDLMTTLAFSSVDNADEAIDGLLSRLERSRQYLNEKRAEYQAAGYFKAIADILTDVRNNPFTDHASFNSRVSEILRQLSFARPEGEAPAGLYYPEFDTDPNGTTALAMLALFQKEQAKEGTVVLTFGGNLVVGDTVLGAEHENSFKNKQANAANTFPLYGLAPVLQNDTISFVNLEAPLTNSSEAASVTGSYKGSPAYASLLKENGVDAVTIANNGVKDYGDSGYSDTIKSLKEAKVEYVEDGAILYYETQAGTIAYVSYNIIDQTAQNVNLGITPNVDIARAKEGGAKIVVVHFNWSASAGNDPTATDTQLTLARNAADAGADLVFATHPSFMQTVLRRKGVSIICSPGDLFKNESTAKTAFLFQQCFTVSGDSVTRGEIRAFPITTSYGDDGTPRLLLDASSASTFVGTLQNASGAVVGGLGREKDSGRADSLQLSDFHVISLTK